MTYVAWKVCAARPADMSIRQFGEGGPDAGYDHAFGVSLGQPEWGPRPPFW
jgi:hypothetical protein